MGTNRKKRLCPTTTEEARTPLLFTVTSCHTKVLMNLLATIVQSRWSCLFPGHAFDRLLNVDASQTLGNSRKFGDHLCNLLRQFAGT